MSALDALPVRGRPPGLPVPPERMPPFRDGRPLKRWRYVGLWGEETMLCAARVSIGAVLPQCFWAIWARDGGMRERTLWRPGAVAADDDRLRAGPIDVRLEPDGEPIEVASRHGDSYIWTRKLPLVAEGVVAGRRVRLRGLLDDSAGYHARRTAWRWCAGVGESPSGELLAWTLVEGMHDAERGSERTVWVDGAPREIPPAAIAPDLTAVTGRDWEELRFAETARRARRDNYVLISSDYAHLFGTVSGTLPGGQPVARGWGVMERHEARW
jgi:hypothetical protein